MYACKYVCMYMYIFVYYVKRRYIYIHVSPFNDDTLDR